MGGFERSIFMGDLHIPYQDKQAIDTALAFVRYYKPHVLFLMGDVMDCMGLSRFSNQDPGKIRHLSDEIKQTRKFLDELRASTTAKIYYLQGNHCLRLTKYIRDHAPELHDLPELSIDHLLNLNSYDITFIPNFINYHGFIVKHGHVIRKYAGYSAHGEMERAGVSGISGHSHRLASVYLTNNHGTFNWVETGCLCRFDQDYLEGSVPNWAKGLAWGMFEREGNKFTVYVQPIVKGKIFFDERIIH